MGRSLEWGQGQGPVHSIRLSTVGAIRPTETGTTHEPTGLDLAMKLHYLKAAYIYSAETARDLTVRHLKEAMFMLFDQIAWTTGRFSRKDSGRPYIKCNDCGTRFVEGQCNLTVEEWLSKPDRSVDEFLIYHQPIGPELTFSPLIYVQVSSDYKNFRFFSLYIPLVHTCIALSLYLNNTHLILIETYIFNYTKGLKMAI